MIELSQLEEELFPEEAEPEGFVIDNMDKAEWAMSKVARAEHRITVLSDLAAKAKARIDARLTQITKADHTTVERMAGLIRPWAEREIAANGKKRSLDILGGRVGFRQSPGRLEITDEETARMWLRNHDHDNCVRVKEEVDKVAVKKLIEAKGEIPPGINMTPGEVRFYIEAARPEIEEEGHGNNR